MTSKEFVNDRIAKLNERLVSNAISDEARAEIEATIANLQALATELTELEAAASEGEEDKSAEMMSQMNEALARITALENKVSTPKVENKMDKSKIKEYGTQFFKMVQNSLNREEFAKNFKDLAVKNGITFSDSDVTHLLPAAVLQEVNDAFVGRRHRILELVDWTGMKVFKAFYETGNDMANLWVSNNYPNAATTAKTEQDQTFTPITIRPQLVYKYVTLDQEVVKMNEGNDDVLLRYIVREMIDRLLTTIEYCILGGTASGSFIAPTATAAVLDANNNIQYHAMNYLPYASGLIAVITPALYISLKQQLQSTYGYYISDEFMAADFFGVDEIVLVPQGFTSSTANSIGLYFLEPRNYKMVGDRRPDQYEDFNLAYNKKEYLTEMWVGGGCITPNFIEITNA